MRRFLSNHSSLKWVPLVFCPTKHSLRPIYIFPSSWISELKSIMCKQLTNVIHYVFREIDYFLFDSDVFSHWTNVLSKLTVKEGLLHCSTASKIDRRPMWFFKQNLMFPFYEIFSEVRFKRCIKQSYLEKFINFATFKSVTIS